MANAFVQSIDSMSIPLGHLQKYTSSNSFAEFYSSTFPIFALSPEVSKTDLLQVAGKANEQAQQELGFSCAELADMGLAAGIPDHWELRKQSPPEAVRWYHDAFDCDGDSENDEPQWYPLGFIGVLGLDWRERGVVLVYLDAQQGQTREEEITVNAYRLHAGQIGPTIVSLRQGDDDYENVKKASVID